MEHSLFGAFKRSKGKVCMHETCHQSVFMVLAEYKGGLRFALLQPV